MSLPPPARLRLQPPPRRTAASFRWTSPTARRLPLRCQAGAPTLRERSVPSWLVGRLKNEEIHGRPPPPLGSSPPHPIICTVAVSNVLFHQRTDAFFAAGSFVLVVKGRHIAGTGTTVVFSCSLSTRSHIPIVRTRIPNTTPAATTATTPVPQPPHAPPPPPYPRLRPQHRPPHLGRPPLPPHRGSAAPHLQPLLLEKAPAVRHTAPLRPRLRAAWARAPCRIRPTRQSLSLPRRPHPQPHHPPPASPAAHVHPQADRVPSQWC